MVLVTNPAGRLVTFRVAPPVVDANAANAASLLRAAVLAVNGLAIICADLTAARTFSGSTTETFSALMRSNNPKIERSALLVSEVSATLSLQVERMAREAPNPCRQIFRDSRSLIEWLTPTVDDDEAAALASFLSCDTPGRRGRSLVGGTD